MRIGIGYDVHRLTAGRKLIIGGVDIPFGRGLLGHSDADVLIHAVIDALFGAVKKRDIGTHFPDTDDAYKDISSMTLLERAALIIYADGYKIVNIDCVVCAQEPRLAPYIGQMEENISKSLNISPGNVSVKAKTEEGLGFTGSGEGISAQAVCLLEKRPAPRFVKA